MIKNFSQNGSAHVAIIITVIAIIAGTLGYLLWQNLSSQSQVQDRKDSVSEKPTEEEKRPEVNVKSLTVSEFGIMVDYSNDLPDLTYTIAATDMDTAYAEIKNESLIGQKCVDDHGLIASVIKNPSSTENQTSFVSTTTLGEDKYYLSLGGSNCASDVELLEKIQESLKSNFTKMRKI